MEKYWKLVISACILPILAVFTIVAYYAEESMAFPIMLIIDVVVIVAGILYYLKYGKK